MAPGKILLSQILITVLIAASGLVLATQFVAYRLAYQYELGRPICVVVGLPLYRPWNILIWWYEFGAYAPKIFADGGVIAAGGGVAALLASVIGSAWRGRRSQPVTTYGSSHWATRRQIVRAGLTADAGVFLGRLGSHYLRHDGPEHVMAFAPTRSGKGVGLVVPTLLSWTGSAIIHDIKGENWNLTAGWRARFSHCLLFNPNDQRSAHYNPLFEVRRGINEVRDAQNIADILIDPEGALERRNHWEKTSHSLLVGVIIHVLYSENEKSLARVAEFLSDPQRSLATTLEVMMSTNHIGTPAAPKVHPVVASAARELLNKSENERSGVLSTATSFLALYRDPIIAEVTSRSDWRIADLMDANQPLSLYLVIPPSDISRTKPLVRLVLNQIGRRLTERLERRGEHSRRHQLLMMLDEFPALGRLDFFETNLAFMAGYGVRAFLIAQSLNQIDKAYGEHNALLDNCHIRVTFATNDERTAKRISDALGTATEERAMRNYAGHRLAPWLAHVMVSRQETARQLLTPGEIMQLPADDELLLIAGMAPIRAKKLRYFDEPILVRRIEPAPMLAADRYADVPPPRPHDWMTAIAPGAAQEKGSVPSPAAKETERPRDAKTRAPRNVDFLNIDDAEDSSGSDTGRSDLPPVAKAHAFVADRDPHNPLPSF